MTENGCIYDLSVKVYTCRFDLKNHKFSSDDKSIAQVHGKVEYLILMHETINSVIYNTEGIGEKTGAGAKTTGTHNIGLFFERAEYMSSDHLKDYINYHYIDRRTETAHDIRISGKSYSGLTMKKTKQIIPNLQKELKNDLFEIYNKTRKGNYERKLNYTFEKNGYIITMKSWIKYEEKGKKLSTGTEFDLKEKKK